MEIRWSKSVFPHFLPRVSCLLLLQMHSGMFTHYIKPVLSAPQIDKLFGLLGYRHCSAPHEQLRLQPPAVTSAAAANLLHLSCSFFLARCECRLLLSALGRRGGEAQWELSLVGERRRGHSLQVSQHVYTLGKTSILLRLRQYSNIFKTSCKHLNVFEISTNRNMLSE